MSKNKKDYSISGLVQRLSENSVDSDYRSILVSESSHLIEQKVVVFDFFALEGLLNEALTGETAAFNFGEEALKRGTSNGAKNAARFLESHLELNKITKSLSTPIQVITRTGETLTDDAARAYLLTIGGQRAGLKGADLAAWQATTLGDYFRKVGGLRSQNAVTNVVKAGFDVAKPGLASSLASNVAGVGEYAGMEALARSTAAAAPKAKPSTALKAPKKAPPLPNPSVLRPSNIPGSASLSISPVNTGVKQASKEALEQAGRMIVELPNGEKFVYETGEAIINKALKETGETVTVASLGLTDDVVKTTGKYALAQTLDAGAKPAGQIAMKAATQAVENGTVGGGKAAAAAKQLSSGIGNITFNLKSVPGLLKALTSAAGQKIAVKLATQMTLGRAIGSLIFGIAGLVYFLADLAGGFAHSWMVGNKTDWANSIKRQAKSKLNLLYMDWAAPSWMELPDSVYDMIMENYRIVEENEGDAKAEEYDNWFTEMLDKEKDEDWGSWFVSAFNPLDNPDQGFGGYDFTDNNEFVEAAKERDFDGLKPKEVDDTRGGAVLAIYADYLISKKRVYPNLPSLDVESQDPEAFTKLEELIEYKYINEKLWEKLAIDFIEEVLKPPGKISLGDDDSDPTGDVETQDREEDVAPKDSQEEKVSSSNPKVKEIQKIVGARTDGIWGRETEGKAAQFVKDRVTAMKVDGKDQRGTALSSAIDRIFKVSWQNNIDRVENVEYVEKKADAAAAKVFFTKEKYPRLFKPTIDGYLEFLRFIDQRAKANVNEMVISESRGSLYRKRYYGRY